MVSFLDERRAFLRVSFIFVYGAFFWGGFGLTAASLGKKGSGAFFVHAVASSGGKVEGGRGYEIEA